jgi:hypothetical protein
MRRKTIQLGGQEMEVLELDFNVRSEQWNEYDLLDGGRVRIKTTPLKIARVLDENGKPAYTPEGDPNIIVNHTTHVVCLEE